LSDIQLAYKPTRPRANAATYLGQLGRPPFKQDTLHSLHSMIFVYIEDQETSKVCIVQISDSEEEEEEE
jgi:hypothetical protein